jgi:hypothetical protein
MSRLTPEGTSAEAGIAGPAVGVSGSAKRRGGYASSSSSPLVRA